MRIHNLDEDRKMDCVGIFLTIEEAKEMRADLDDLIEKPALNHSHLSSKDLHKEISIAIYDENNLDECGFSERVKKLIRKDV